MQSVESQSPTPPAQTQASGCSSRQDYCKREYSIYVGNLDLGTSLHDTEELVYELFLQAGPLTKVLIPFNPQTGIHRGYGFVEFQHTESVPYALKLMAGVRLCGRVLNLRQTAASTDSTAVSSSGGNPFVSALNSHVAQKETELIAANPFFSSLNAHLGGNVLPLPSSVLPPHLPPPPPPHLPPPPPTTLPIPPPGLCPPMFPPPPLPTPPPLPPSFQASAPLQPLPSPHLPQTPNLHPPISSHTLASTADNGSSLWSTLPPLPPPPPVPLFGVVPPPHGKLNSDPPTNSGSLSLEHTLSYQMNQTGPPPPQLEQTKSTTDCSSQQMEECSLSLCHSLNGLTGSLSYTPDGPVNDHGGIMSSHHDQSPSDDIGGPCSLPTNESFTNRGQHSLPTDEPFTNRGQHSLPTDEPFTNRGPHSLPTDEPFTNRGPHSLPIDEPFTNRGPLSLPTDEPFTNRGPHSLPIDEPFTNRGPLSLPTDGPFTNRGPHSLSTDEPFTNRGPHSLSTDELFTNRGQHSLSTDEPFTNRGPHSFSTNGETFNKGPLSYPGGDRNAMSHCYSDDQFDDSSMPNDPSHDPYVNGGLLDNSSGEIHSYDHVSLDVSFSDDPSYPPPNLPFSHHTMPSRSPLMPNHNHLHSSRLGANDHPAWMSQRVKSKLQQHHLKELQETVSRLKVVMEMSRLSPSNPFTSHR